MNGKQIAIHCLVAFGGCCFSLDDQVSAQGVETVVSPIADQAIELRVASVARRDVVTPGHPSRSDQTARRTQASGMVMGTGTPSTSIELPDLPPPGPARRPMQHQVRPTDASWWATRVGGGIGLFVAILMVQRLLGSASSTSLPAGAIQVCGKVPLDSKQQLHLVLIGQRLLVLLESPQGMQRLAEITDPDEVGRLIGSKHSRGNSSKSNSTKESQPSAPTVSDVLSRFREFEGQLG